MTDSYPRPSLTADILVFRPVEGGHELLLIRRKNPPFEGCFALPGGFVEKGETAADAAARELLEETGLSGLSLTPLGLYDTPHRDPRGWVVTEAFLTLAPGAVPIAGDDAADAEFFEIGFHREEELLRLTLTGTNETLSALCRVAERMTPFGVCREAEVLSSEGLAFDHARIIAEGLLLWEATPMPC